MKLKKIVKKLEKKVPEGFYLYKKDKITLDDFIEKIIYFENLKNKESDYNEEDINNFHNVISELMHTKITEIEL